MIGMTLCSGIGAPEIAAPWIDWRLAAEIEAFPRAVLQHRFGYRTPTDHNQGDPLLWADMTEVTPELLRKRGIPLPEIIVAGTPCQAFSVAGLRQGLEDPRGNLTLAFVEILHAIVAARPDGRLIAVWENVPGVLSDNGNAFGCFLGGLVGALDALLPPGDGRWPSEGMVQGPRARAAWAVLDAQWFGVAQRRRRVFVVVDFGGAVDPAAVLLEPDRLRGDSPPRREAGEVVAPKTSARPTGGGGLGTDFDCDGGLIPEIVPQAMSAKWSKGSSGPAGDEVANLIPVAHSLRGEGFDASEDGTGRGTPIVPVEQPFVMMERGRAGGSNLEFRQDGTANAILTPNGGRGGLGVGAVAFDCKGSQVQHDESGASPTLRAMGHADFHANAGGHLAVAFDLAQITSKANRSTLQPVCPTMAKNSDLHAVEQLSVSKRNETLYSGGVKRREDADASTQEAHPRTLLRGVRSALGEEAFAQWGLGILNSLQSPEILRSALHGSELRPAAFSRSWVVHCTLSRPEDRAAGVVQSMREARGEGRSSPGWEPSEQRSKQLGAYLSELSQPGPQAERFLCDLWEATEGLGVLREALSAVQEARRPACREGQSAHSGWAVRRLTVEECEFLQGFPRGFTAIPWRGKPGAPDGPQYKALGNSMAVPVMRWILDRVRISATAHRKPQLQTLFDGAAE